MKMKRKNCNKCSKREQCCENRELALKCQKNMR